MKISKELSFWLTLGNIFSIIILFICVIGAAVAKNDEGNITINAGCLLLVFPMFIYNIAQLAINYANLIDENK